MIARVRSSRPGFVWLAVVISAALFGCSGNSGPTGSQPSGRADTPKQSGGPSADTPAVKASAEEFFAEWKKDSKAAFAKYGKAVVELTGTITDIHPDDTGKGSVVALGTKEEGYGVPCNFTEPAVWTKVSFGQKVKIKGMGPEEDFGRGILSKCAFIDLPPAPTPALTAEQLAKEYAADKKGTVEKYKDKLILLSGEVAPKPADKKGWLYLKGDGKIQVNCSFPYPREAQADAVPVGQQAKVLGKFIPSEQTDNSVGLRFCYAIK